MKKKYLLTIPFSFLLGSLIIWPIHYLFVSTPENYYNHSGWAISFDQWKSMIIFDSLLQSALGYMFAKIGFILLGLAIIFLYSNRSKFYNILSVFIPLFQIGILIFYIFREEIIRNCDFFGGSCGYDPLLSMSAYIIYLISSLFFIFCSIKLKQTDENWKGNYFFALVLFVYGIIFGVAGIGYSAMILVPISVFVLIGEIVYFIKLISRKTQTGISS